LNELLEKLAALEHERWAGWMRYLFTKGEDLPNGLVLLGGNWADRWRRQMDTPYEQLSEAEKESGRKEVRKTLELLEPRGDALADYFAVGRRVYIEQNSALQAELATLRAENAGLMELNHAARAELERLRGLVKQVGTRPARHCPWCSGHRVEIHDDECPAFNTDGTVK